MTAAMRRQASRLLPRRPRAHFLISFGWCRCAADARTVPPAQLAKMAIRRQDARDEDVSQEAAEWRLKERGIRDREERLESAHCCHSVFHDHSRGCFV
jgi:hypothetical protein